MSMSDSSEKNSLIVSVEIDLDPGEAYDRFTSGMMDWWPKAYTWSGEALTHISIGEHVDGPLQEIGPYGFRCDFGRVLESIRGERIRFTWQISPRREPVPDPAQAGEIDVSFQKVKWQRTLVTLKHLHFERYGEGADEYRNAMASKSGWPLILRAFAELR